MKVQIEANGSLCLSAENDVEQYVLSLWRNKRPVIHKVQREGEGVTGLVLRFNGKTEKTEKARTPERETGDVERGPAPAMPEREERVCEQCGADISGLGRKARFCADCIRAHKRTADRTYHAKQRALVGKTRVCKHCGTEIKGDGQRTVCDACKTAQLEKQAQLMREKRAEKRAVKLPEEDQKALADEFIDAERDLGVFAKQRELSVETARAFLKCHGIDPDYPEAGEPGWAGASPGQRGPVRVAG